MQQVGVDRERRVAPLVLGDRDLVLLGEGEERRARRELPFPPGRDDPDVGIERIGRQARSAPGRCPCRSSRGKSRPRRLCMGDLDQPLGDQRTRDRGAEQILALVERVGAEHREHEVAHEFLAQVLDEDVLRLDAEELRLFPRRLELLALAEVGGEGDDLGAIFGLQPLEDDRGVEPARIGEHDALDLGFGAGHGVRVRRKRRRFARISPAYRCSEPCAILPAARRCGAR